MTTVLRLAESHRTPPALDLSESTLGRRVAIRNWFHSLYREKPDEQFDGDECISLEEAESLVMVPSFNLTSAQTSTGSSKDASFDKKQNHRHREKIRELKVHLKVKLSHFKHRHERNTCERGITHRDTKNEIGRTCAENINVQELFDQHAEENIVLAIEGQKPLTESILRPLVDGDSRKVSEVDSETGEVSSNPVGSCRMKRQNNHDDIDIGSIKRPCSSKEISPGSSAETSEDHSNANESERSSIEKTPSAYLAGLPINSEIKSEHTDPTPSSAEPSAEMAVNSSMELDQVDSDSIDSCDDFSTSQDTSFSDEFSATEGETAPNSEQFVSPITGEKVYTIPTFRQKVGSLNVANIARNFKEGSLSEDQLIAIVSRGADGHGDLTFKNKEFYDEPSSKASKIDSSEGKDSGKLPNEVGSNAKASINFEDKKPAGTVKFDRFSCLIVYETSANPSSLKPKEAVGVRNGQETIGTIRSAGSPSQGPKKSGTKSILKVKSNLRAREENKRAKDCDRVAIDSFMNLFEHFEHKKQMEECMLAEVREGQLNNYFSENFFPEILEDVTITTSASSEFSRSRKATELNIGRKLGAINMIHYICENCDTAVVARSVRSKRK